MKAVRAIEVGMLLFHSSNFLIFLLWHKTKRFVEHFFQLPFFLNNYFLLLKTSLFFGNLPIKSCLCLFHIPFFVFQFPSMFFNLVTLSFSSHGWSAFIFSFLLLCIWSHKDTQLLDARSSQTWGCFFVPPTHKYLCQHLNKGRHK